MAAGADNIENQSDSGLHALIYDAHRLPHEVVLMAGDMFQSCNTCLERVRFRLVRFGPYIFSDEDFADQE